MRSRTLPEAPRNTELSTQQLLKNGFLDRVLYSVSLSDTHTVEISGSPVCIYQGTVFFSMGQFLFTSSFSLDLNCEESKTTDPLMTAHTDFLLMNI